MHDLKTAINSVGLLVSIIGVYLVYRFSPLNFDTIDGGAPDTDFDAIRRETSRRNRLVRVGAYMVLGGTFLQLGSNFLSSKP